MTYRVILSRLAVADLDQAYQWAATHAPDTARAWLFRFKDLLARLAEHPERCPLAYENKKVAIEICERLLGTRSNAYRVIFTIDENSVRVLRIRRGQRRFLTRRQIEEVREDE